jgi:hypothetical protein
MVSFHPGQSEQGGSTMKHKILLMSSLLLVLSLGFATVGYAAEAPNETETSAADAATADQAVFAGTGWLWAKGAGHAQVHGDGVVKIAGHGAATIRVEGADVLRAQGRGRRWDLPDGSTVFAGWRGRIHATGEELDVKMWGGIIEFGAKGTGWVFLRGRGHYRVNGQPGFWTAEGMRLELPATDTS